MRNQILEVRKKKKLAGCSVVLLCMTYRSCSLPDPRAKLNMMAENTSFSLLSLLTNVIKCLINYIPKAN